MKLDKTIGKDGRKNGGFFSASTTALSASVLCGVAICGAAGDWVNGANKASGADFFAVATAFSASENVGGSENEKKARDFLLSPTFFDEFFATDRTELIDFNEKTVDLNYASEPDAERFSLDLPFEADCSTFDRFAISCRLENPEGIGSATLYFKSGAGWYSMTGAPRRSSTGETSYLFEKNGYMSEGKPTGWDEIDAIRVSFWRGGPVDGRVAVRFADSRRRRNRRERLGRVDLRSFVESRRVLGRANRRGRRFGGGVARAALRFPPDRRADSARDGRRALRLRRRRRVRLCFLQRAGKIVAKTRVRTRSLRPLRGRRVRRRGDALRRKRFARSGGARVRVAVDDRTTFLGVNDGGTDFRLGIWADFADFRG